MLIDNPEVTVEELMTVIPGPDFPTGGTIMGRDGIRSAYETGRGSITTRGKAHIEQTSTGRTRIIVTEIPYQVNKSKLVTKIADLVREKKLTEISDLRDESDRKGMRVVIELKNNCIPQVVLNKLFKHTQLQQGFGVIMLSLVDGVPRTLNLKEMLYYYVEHQKDVIVRRTRYELRKAEERAHILEGYVIALDNIDEVIKIIRASQTDVEAKTRLIERFGLSEIQTDAILEMRLRRLTGLERHKIEDELTELREKIAWYQKVLGDITLVLNIIKEELLELRGKHADKRRTEISRRPRTSTWKTSSPRKTWSSPSLRPATSSGFLWRRTASRSAAARGCRASTSRTRTSSSTSSSRAPTTTCSSSRPGARSTG